MTKETQEKLQQKDSFFRVWSGLVSQYGSGTGDSMNKVAIDILNRLYVEHYRGTIAPNMIIEYDMVDLVD